MDLINGWNGAGVAEINRAEEAAKKAINIIDHNTPLAHHALGWVHRLRGQHQDALNAFSEAIRIDPNFARGHTQVANEMVFLGRASDAIPLVEKAIQLDPMASSRGGLGGSRVAPIPRSETIPRRSRLLNKRSIYGPTFGMLELGWPPPMPSPIKTPRRGKQSKHSRKCSHNTTLIGSPNTTRNSSSKVPMKRASDQMLDGLRKAGLK